MARSIVVLDYGSSNLHSVAKALERVADGGYKVVISVDPETILSAAKIVFPGQGAIAQCMESLTKQGLDQVILDSIRSKPFLGICLGLQTLMEYSVENHGINGLGVIPGKVLRFQAKVRNDQGEIYKIPHMGWNKVYQSRPHPLWQGIQDGSYFYFVHSYYARPQLADCVVGTTRYVCEYASAIAQGNLFATQFHPEKSQRDGLRLLKNFIDWDGTV